MQTKEKLLNLTEEEYKNLLDTLRILMDECDSIYLKYKNQLRRNNRLINHLIEDNKKMTKEIKKIFGRRNNRLIKETEKKNEILRRNLTLKDPLGEFDDKCLMNGINPQKLREIFSEERGWSLVITYDE